MTTRSGCLHFDWITLGVIPDELEASNQDFDHSDEPWQSLCRAAARNKPNRHFWLTENCFANGSKTHVHGQRDLIASTPAPSFDFGDGYCPEAACRQRS